MAFKPEGNLVIECPHEFQRYVDCSDETAKELAGLIYVIAADFVLRDSIREGAARYSASDALILLMTILSDYDVFLQTHFEKIVLRRYERPPIGDEGREITAFRKYLQDTKFDAVQIPYNIPDIVRAFGEFGRKDVDPEIIDCCFGFYDVPDCKCPICGKNWEKTWDE